MSKNKNNNMGVVINEGSFNPETGEIIEKTIVFDGESINDYNQYLDNVDHEMFIHAVNSINESTNILKNDLKYRAFLTGAFAMVAIFNANAIITGESSLEFLSYVAGSIGIGGVIYNVMKAFRKIQTIISMRPFVKSSNEYVIEHYPDEADKVNMPRRLIKTIKKKQNEKEES